MYKSSCYGFYILSLRPVDMMSTGCCGHHSNNTTLTALVRIWCFPWLQQPVRIKLAFDTILPHENSTLTIYVSLTTVGSLKLLGGTSINMCFAIGPTSG